MYPPLYRAGAEIKLGGSQFSPDVNEFVQDLESMELVLMN
jgi:hypothetical protein